ncbi:hypothetical protein EUGRSUZ_J02717 [Eucalyptus grandis]|uniref:Uncharacterized protein n=2 Tax=Eucalyptus grandis TaxID=71139 RepID=A0ACC3J997_EUCGR|nr:hypothetical protein EUGRSUZ_J02717 [Eucalyptus grandis]
MEGDLLSYCPPLKFHASLTCQIKIYLTPKTVVRDKLASCTGMGSTDMINVQVKQLFSAFSLSIDLLGFIHITAGDL